MPNKIMLCWYILFLPFISCSQTKDSSIYNESNYIEKKRGEDDGYPYVILYVNRYDTTYRFKKNFMFDSTQLGNSYSKTFYYKDVPAGPFESMVYGEISQRGTFKNGRYDGEKLSFTNGKLTQKAYFKAGKKIGIWEKYDIKGKLLKKTTYDNRGKIIKEEEFDNSFT